MKHKPETKADLDKHGPYWWRWCPTDGWTPEHVLRRYSDGVLAYRYGRVDCSDNIWGGPCVPPDWSPTVGAFAPLPLSMLPSWEGGAVATA